jgi:hypothetical protein
LRASLKTCHRITQKSLLAGFRCVTAKLQWAFLTSVTVPV